MTTPITFRVTNRSDADTQNPSAPIDLLWSSTCQEGQVGLACTVIPMVEGTYTIGLLATDDDGATTQVQYSVSVSNSAPTDPVAEVWIEPNRLVTDSRGVYIVQEGDVITLMGQADDSSNDLDTLMHIWRPDAENHPEFNNTSIGRTSITNHTYNASGMHLATLQVFDDDGASTEMLIVPIEVQNVPPQYIQYLLRTQSRRTSNCPSISALLIQPTTSSVLRTASIYNPLWTRTQMATRRTIVMSRPNT